MKVETRKVLKNKEGSIMETISIIPSIRTFFLGVKILDERMRGVAWLYPGTWMNNYARKHELAGKEIYLTQSSSPLEIINVYKNSNITPQCKGGVCSLDSTYLIIPSVIEDTKIEDDGKIRLTIAMKAESYVIPERICLTNRFTSLLIEALVSLSRYHFFCGTKNAKLHEMDLEWLWQRMIRLAGSREEKETLQILAEMKKRCPSH